MFLYDSRNDNGDGFKAWLRIARDGGFPTEWPVLVLNGQDGEIEIFDRSEIEALIKAAQEALVAFDARAKREWGAAA